MLCPVNDAGLKLLPLTPVPDQVPPVLPVTRADRFTVPDPEHTVPGLVQAALGVGVTVTVTCAQTLLPQRSSALTK